MKIFFNKKNIILFLTSLFLILILAIFIIYPLFSAIKKDSADLVSVKKEILFFSQKSGDAGKIKENFSQVEPSLKKIESLFVNSEVPISFIEFLEQTALGCNLNISISPSDNKKSDTDYWESMTFQINLAGSYQDILKFLEKIESADYLIEEQSLGMHVLSGQNAENLIGKKFSGENIGALLTIKVYTK